MFSIPIDLSSLTTVNGIIQYSLSNAVVSGILLAGLSGLAYKCSRLLIQWAKKILGIYMFPMYVSHEMTKNTNVIATNLINDNKNRFSSHHILSGSDALVTNTVYYFRVNRKWVRVIMTERALSSSIDTSVIPVTYRLTIVGLFMTSRTLSDIINHLNKFRHGDNELTISKLPNVYGRIGTGKTICIDVRTIDDIACANATRTAILSVISSFKEKHSLRKRMFVPNKLTILMSGPPGTGKSSLAMCIAWMFKDASLYVVPDFCIMTQSEELDENKVVILNDIDAVQDGSVILTREGKSAHGPANYGPEPAISMSNILTYLDFVTLPSDVYQITIMTTNHPEKIDPAFLRAGRIDLHLHVDYPQYDDLMTYYSRIRHDDDPTNMVQYMIDNNVIVPAMNTAIVNTDTYDDALALYVKQHPATNVVLPLHEAAIQ